jgi:hypothetical protein
MHVGARVGGSSQVVGIDAELEAAEQASGALSRSPANPTIVQTLRRAYITAKRANSNPSIHKALNEARHTVGTALPDLIRTIENGRPLREKANSAKRAVEIWIQLLKAS